MGMFLNLGSPLAAELCGNAGFDWLVVDMEHGNVTEANVLQMLQAISATPASAVVRVEEGVRLRIGRALDWGAPNVMVPRVETPLDAERIASYMRYPPTGTRGVAMGTRSAGHGALRHGDFATAHESLCLFLQVESEDAVEAVHDIASIDGVDVLFVGPSDLSHALGSAGDSSDPRFRAAVARVGRAAADAGKAAGVLLWSIDELPMYVDAGYRLIALGSDSGYVASGAREARRRLADAQPR